TVLCESSLKDSQRTVPTEFLGLCFDFQKIKEVPVDANDIPVDLVI
ncbi:MAG: hypothetical protein IJQ13_07965, partial [Prevotella sp.]|nr:hypothetical protein [Prevotella sp.]